MFITKKKHDAIVKDLLTRVDMYKQYDEMRKDNQKNNNILIEILEKLANKSNLYADASMSYVTGTDIMAHLDDSVPRYVEDYFGGKVIKQEATPVTILDSKGKATYGLTKMPPDKNREYKLVQS